MAAIAAAACGGRSDDELRAELAALVAASNDCAETSECVTAHLGCVLGCWAAVHRDEQTTVEVQATELMHERGSQVTECECKPKPGAVCTDGHCTLTSPPF